MPGYRCHTLLGATLLAAPFLSASAAVFTVGNDGSCTHDSIQAAINAAAANGPGVDDIRILAGVREAQALRIADQSVQISGGWPSCTASAPAGVTELHGGQGSVVQVRGAGGGDVHTVHLSRLRLTQGNGGDDGRGGGLDAEGALRVVLADVEIDHNEAFQGGGGAFIGGPSSGFGGILELHRGVVIHHNRATQGAGARGGGIQVERASLRVRADAVEIRDNDAVFGGGIHVQQGQVSIGNSGEPEVTQNATGLRISGNHAHIGGGVYVFGSGALFDAYELRLENNRADQYGGGLYASGGAQIQIQRDYPNANAVQCSGPDCSRIAGNQAGDGCPGTRGHGGGVYLDNARAYISQTEFRDNCAYGSPALNTWGPFLRVNSVLFARNRLTARGFDQTGAQTVSISSRNGDPARDIEMNFATFADNVFVGEGGATTPATSLYAASPGDRFVMRASAFKDPVPWTVTSAGACNRSGLTGAEFVAGGIGNYRPEAGSPLVDACSSTDVPVNSRDPELRARCLDNPVPDRGGTCDIGAYEREAGTPTDRLFANGFES
ncbi:hypothetical protein [Tahibacter amnicola]|uniref:CSLREA domain-containing protein n=1 Tax=Tahibacter amnicola TaxID=2976241 RepID=A0ABY6BCM5_9GAMM|nr:hypothetical protein [Tahibacter amnicola]UXI66875.1 hypothetical protein N4264_19260 [Tahibacter amnicola]